EVFDVSVLPRRAGFDVKGLNAPALEPFPHGTRDELRAVVTADALGDAVLPHGRLQHRGHVPPADGPCGMSGKALARAFIHQRQNAERAAALRPITDK